MDFIKFLGTGGGRYTTITQKRHTGGIILKLEGRQIHIDPGPGALVRAIENGIDALKTDILLVSHQHIDHSNDANIMIEAMTRFTKAKRGTLICSEGADKSAITSYHKKLLERAEVIRPGQTIEAYGIRFTGMKCRHTRPEAVGFKIAAKDITIYYTSDTYVYKGFENNLNDADVLIANNILPKFSPLEYHMCSDKLIDAVKKSNGRLKKIIITHFDLKMLEEGPENEARRIEKETGIKTIAAKDGMSVTIT